MNRLPLSMERSIKSIIEKTKCSIHGNHPEVTFTQQGFNVSCCCCCEKFRKDTISKCQEAIGEALQEQLSKAFKRLK